MNNDQYALVTGSGRGIGRALAHELAKRGYNLALHSLPGENLAEYADELSVSYGIRTLSYEVDLTSDDGPSRLYNSVLNDGVNISILVNNAGIGNEGPLESYSQDTVNNIILLNIRALTILTFLFIPELKKRNSFLLNVSSLGSFLPIPYKSVYLASKSYIYYFSRSLEAEFMGSSVKVCILAPGGVHTNSRVSKSIAASGWLPGKTSLDADEVAAKCIDGMFRGRSVVIPGSLINMCFYFGQILPVCIAQSIARKIYRNDSAV